MKKTNIALAALFLLSPATIFAGKKKQLPPMNEFVTELMQKMTLEEKIGQLNLLPGGDLTTGAVMNSPLAEKVEAGELGAILNVKGVEKIKNLQEIASCQEDTPRHPSYLRTRRHPWLSDRIPIAVGSSLFVGFGDD